MNFYIIAIYCTQNLLLSSAEAFVTCDFAAFQFIYNLQYLQQITCSSHSMHTEISVSIDE